MLTTVPNNKEIYTNQETKGANKVRKTQQIIGWPSTVDLNHYMK